MFSDPGDLGSGLLQASKPSLLLSERRGTGLCLAWRVSIGLAIMLSVIATSLVVAVLAAEGQLGDVLVRLDPGRLRVVAIGFIGIMAIGPLVFIAMIWLAVLRERRQTEALTLLRQNRESLRASRDQMRRVFASLPLPYVLTQMDGSVVQANAQAIRLFGLDEGNLSASNLFTLHANVGFNEELQGYLQNSGRFENFEIAFHGQNARRFYALFSAARVEMDGAPLIFAAFSDITERKRAEQALQKNETALRAIIDASPVPVSLSRHEAGDVVYMNQAAVKFFALSMKDLIGVPASTHWENAEQYARLLAELNACGHIEDREVRLRRNGRPCWVAMSTTILRLQDETLVYTAFLDISERKRKENELHLLATTDPLTGALNRRAFTERCTVEHQRAVRGGYPVALVVCDLDYFKAVNDTYGHAVGDTVLKQFTAVVAELVRPGDAWGRIGGEEFALLLPGSDVSNASQVAERIRHRFAVVGIKAGDGAPVSVTASFGVASWAHVQTFEQAFSSADAALYVAKAGGRNRVDIAVE